MKNTNLQDYRAEQIMKAQRIMPWVSLTVPIIIVLVYIWAYAKTRTVPADLMACLEYSWVPGAVLLLAAGISIVSMVIIIMNDRKARWFIYVAIIFVHAVCVLVVPYGFAGIAAITIIVFLGFLSDKKAKENIA